jgi:hypothetical protein
MSDVVPVGGGGAAAAAAVVDGDALVAALPAAPVTAASAVAGGVGGQDDEKVRAFLRACESDSEAVVEWQFDVVLPRPGGAGFTVEAVCVALEKQYGLGKFIGVSLSDKGFTCAAVDLAAARALDDGGLRMGGLVLRSKRTIDRRVMLWLSSVPLGMTNGVIKRALAHVADVVSITRHKAKATRLLNGCASVECLVHDGATRDQVPGMIKFGEYKVLVAGKGVRRVCLVCGEDSHIARDCPTKKAERKCFSCGESGHEKRACPRSHPGKKGVVLARSAVAAPAGQVPAAARAATAAPAAAAAAGGASPAAEKPASPAAAPQVGAAAQERDEDGENRSWTLVTNGPRMHVESIVNGGRRAIPVPLATASAAAAAAATPASRPAKQVASRSSAAPASVPMPIVIEDVDEMEDDDDDDDILIERALSASQPVMAAARTDKSLASTLPRPSAKHPLHNSRKGSASSGTPRVAKTVKRAEQSKKQKLVAEKAAAAATLKAQPHAMARSMLREPVAPPVPPGGDPPPQRGLFDDDIVSSCSDASTSESDESDRMWSDTEEDTLPLGERLRVRNIEHARRVLEMDDIDALAEDLFGTPVDPDLARIEAEAGRPAEQPAASAAEAAVVPTPAASEESAASQSQRRAPPAAAAAGTGAPPRAAVEAQSGHRRPSHSIQSADGVGDVQCEGSEAEVAARCRVRVAARRRCECGVSPGDAL